MRILVTGANGLLGQKLVALLSATDGVTLLATGRGPNRNPPGHYVYLPCDLTHAASARDMVQSSGPQVIIHTAAMTQVDDCEQDPLACHRANVTATASLLQATREVAAFFLFLSTDFVFDGQKGRYTETDLPNPLSYYGRSKLEAEQLTQQAGVPWAIVRTVLVYGVAHNPSRSNIVLWVKRSLEEGKPIKVVNDQWRTPTLSEDLATGCWQVASGRHEGVFHISGDQLMTPYDIAMKTAAAFELDASLISAVDASTFTQPGKRPPKTGFDICKARNVLGFRPVTFLKGLEILKTQLSSD